jgi:hypothetical protein
VIFWPNIAAKYRYKPIQPISQSIILDISTLKSFSNLVHCPLCLMLHLINPNPTRGPKQTTVYHYNNMIDEENNCKGDRKNAKEKWVLRKDVNILGNIVQGGYIAKRYQDLYNHQIFYESAYIVHFSRFRNILWLTKCGRLNRVAIGAQSRVSTAFSSSSSSLI